ncbi:type II secretion system F family protein [Paracraurococcus ruber]|uniref:Type II secretion system protein GspF domain-containing protein n=1 Tax=Paracraurococcus ruber TaxID=77675 RepID=A0ABS1CV36_9PROT|nr:type II secretion system F family protein [Paracraurococcus ruber]MBK1658376.1 hypothetical protein [Paracraurococcus ruber]TDG30580.1 type II secretion system F family protein [Paracraurococcus ruber]
MTPPLGMPLLWAGLFALLAIGLLGMVLLQQMDRHRRVFARLEAVQRAAGIDQVVLPWSLRRLLLRLLAGIGRLLTQGGVLSARTVAELEQTLTAAGFRGDRALSIFVGAKMLLLPGLPLLAVAGLHLAGAGQPAWSVGLIAAAIAGLLLPDMTVRRLRRAYLRELERGLPDGLDLMVICAEAGLSLETAIERVSVEIAPANRAVAAEFALCASELRILADRRTALANMAERTGLDLLRRIGMTLAQTLQYGTPLTKALRTLSAEMRQEQLTRFEARAARLPVLLTVPMIAFILPTLFLVVGGPAVLQLIRLW